MGEGGEGGERGEEEEEGVKLGGGVDSVGRRGQPWRRLGGVWESASGKANDEAAEEGRRKVGEDGVLVKDLPLTRLSRLSFLHPLPSSLLPSFFLFLYFFFLFLSFF